MGGFLERDPKLSGLEIEGSKGALRVRITLI